MFDKLLFFAKLEIGGNMFKKIVVAYDHNAKPKVIERLKQVILKFGVDVQVLEDEKTDNDYPILAELAYETYKKTGADGIILLCGTGIGMNIVANKFDGIRSVLGTGTEYAYFSRRHENANCLVLAAGYQDGDMQVKFCGRKMERLVETFLSTEFQGEERHKRRIEEISKIEKKN